MRPRPFLVVALVGALLGFGFASVSTYDFAQHLDRQVHDVHCSFVPGLEGDDKGGSGCEVTLMSTYSSVFRSSVWGGIPIALPAMSVFAFLLFFGIDLVLGRRQTDRRATGFFALAALLPALMSVIMGYISLSLLDAACKLCIGIYVASAVALIGAGGLWWRASGPSIGGAMADEVSSGPAGHDPAWAEDDGLDDDGLDGELDDGASLEDPGAEFDGTGTMGGGFDGGGYGSDGPMSYPKLAGAFALGVLFVAVPVAAYVGSAPDHSKFVGKCGSIDSRPKSDLLVEMGPQNGVPALEVFDPLCPACRGFEDHLEQTVYDDKLARKAVLFPLDDECNWMVDRAVHPGACAVSEAVLCAGGDAQKVIDWAFEHHEEIRKTAASEDGGARRMVEEQFPEMASCLGSPKVQDRLNQSLRWAVDNEIKVLTPQLYVDGVRLCDEDVDLGLEYALGEMLARHRDGTLQHVAEASDEDEEGDE